MSFCYVLERNIFNDKSPFQFKRLKQATLSSYSSIISVEFDFIVNDKLHDSAPLFYSLEDDFFNNEKLLNVCNNIPSDGQIIVAGKETDYFKYCEGNLFSQQILGKMVSQMNLNEIPVHEVKSYEQRRNLKLERTTLKLLTKSIY